ncbi:hypothetical protein [Blastopirellula marina]|uniref:PH domain-containing protein n=1 Tax=Blastopirellula marina TaxID=124 RepID=A0A2S8F3F6_9BACT|nr:hypothetical protein [Blastopirellula marina]PQO26464.1 hypothetical protein C5Y98_30465 [Blastopirellula marina]PQO46901.1 hypothetical protein C5Y93_07045 [Blastopirellula marina]PTL40777.1 hypothetical protein C5Y97_30480 [Blastopirellula marina]
MIGSSYRHKQYAPLCWLVAATSIPAFVAAWALRGDPVGFLVIAAAGLLLLVLSASCWYLQIADDEDSLLVSFGPIPILRRRIRYDRIQAAHVSQTTVLDGWGIHWSMRGGWVWNIWGWDCVEIELEKGKVIVGTDDAENLAAFVKSRIPARPAA